MEGSIDEQYRVIDTIPDWALATSFSARENGQPDLFATCVPSSIEVITVFCVGRRVDRVQKKRMLLMNCVAKVEEIVQEVCQEMPQYRFVTVNMIATKGAIAPKIEPVSATETVAWPETLYGLSKLDCLLIIARKKPRICMTKRQLVARGGSRRTRKKPILAKIERA